MDLLLILQVTASAAATACCGASLSLWLLSSGNLNQRALDKKLLIISQAVIYGVIIIGSFVSCFLVIQQTKFKSGK